MEDTTRDFQEWLGAYAIALVLVALVFLLPPSNDVGFLLALPVLSVMLLVTAAPSVGVAVAVVSVMLGRLRINVGDMVLPVADVAVLGLCCAALVRLFINQSREKMPAPAYAYGVFLLAAFVSALLSTSAPSSLYFAVRHYAFYGLGYLLALSPAMRNSPRQAINGLLIPLVPAVVVSLVFSAQRILYLGDLWADVPLDGWPFGGVQKALPVYIAILWPWIRYLRRRAVSIFDRQLLRTLEYAMLLAVAVGFAKSAWLIILVGALAIRAVEDGPRDHNLLRRRLLVATAMTAALIMVLAVLLTWIDPGSFFHRAAQWVAAYDFWQRSPVFGNGPGTAAGFLAESVAAFLFRSGAATVTTEPHGFPPKILGEVGMVGFLLFCVFLYSLLAFSVNSLRGTQGDLRAQRVAGVATLAALVTHLLASPNTFSPFTWFVFALALAVARGIRDDVRPEHC